MIADRARRRNPVSTGLKAITRIDHHHNPLNPVP